MLSNPGSLEKLRRCVKTSCMRRSQEAFNDTEFARKEQLTNCWRGIHQRRCCRYGWLEKLHCEQEFHALSTSHTPRLPRKQVNIAILCTPVPPPRWLIGGPQLALVGSALSPTHCGSRGKKKRAAGFPGVEHRLVIHCGSQTNVSKRYGICVHVFGRRYVLALRIVWRCLTTYTTAGFEIIKSFTEDVFPGQHLTHRHSHCEQGGHGSFDGAGDSLKGDEENLCRCHSNGGQAPAVKRARLSVTSSLRRLVEDSIKHGKKKWRFLAKA